VCVCVYNVHNLQREVVDKAKSTILKILGYSYSGIWTPTFTTSKSFIRLRVSHIQL